MAPRQPVRPINQSPVQIARASKAEAERKKASKAALKAAKQAEQAAPATETPEAPKQISAPVVEKDRSAEYAAALKALTEDAIAMHGGEATEAQIAEYIREQGVDPATGAPILAKTPYSGPMIALKTARQHYQKAANGVQCNGDKLATLCGRYSRADTVAALIVALGLPSNPYSHLNPGQQSMNLRNKARHAVNEGRLALAQIQAAYDANGAKPV